MSSSSSSGGRPPRSPRPPTLQVRAANGKPPIAGANPKRQLRRHNSRRRRHRHRGSGTGRPYPMVVTFPRLVDGKMIIGGVLLNAKQLQKICQATKQVQQRHVPQKIASRVSQTTKKGHRGSLVSHDAMILPREASTTNAQPSSSSTISTTATDMSDGESLTSSDSTSKRVNRKRVKKIRRRHKKTAPAPAPALSNGAAEDEQSNSHSTITTTKGRHRRGGGATVSSIPLVLRRMRDSRREKRRQQKKLQTGQGDDDFGNKTNKNNNEKNLPSCTSDALPSSSTEAIVRDEKKEEAKRRNKDIWVELYDEKTNRTYFKSLKTKERQSYPPESATRIIYWQQIVSSVSLSTLQQMSMSSSPIARPEQPGVRSSPSEEVDSCPKLKKSFAQKCATVMGFRGNVEHISEHNDVNKSKTEKASRCGDNPHRAIPRRKRLSQTAACF